MQKWEYMFVHRTRGFEVLDEENKIYQHGDDWYTTANDEKITVGIAIYLQELGEQGWELVSIATLSDVGGGNRTIVGDVHTKNAGTMLSAVVEGKIYGVVADFAGITTTEKWIFKRPKE
jgi:hypothetical protein